MMKQQVEEAVYQVLFEGKEYNLQIDNKLEEFKTIRESVLGYAIDLAEGAADNLVNMFAEEPVEEFFKSIKTEVQYIAELQLKSVNLIEGFIERSDNPQFIGLYMRLKDELLRTIDNERKYHKEVIAEYTAKNILRSLERIHGESNYYIYQDVNGDIFGNMNEDFNNFGEKAKYKMKLVVTKGEKVSWLKKFLLNREHTFWGFGMRSALYIQKDENYFAVKSHELYLDEEYIPKFGESMMVIFEG